MLSYPALMSDIGLFGRTLVFELLAYPTMNLLIMDSLILLFQPRVSPVQEIVL